MTDQLVPQIKICGVTSLQDAGVVVDAGADALGLIYASSVRQVVGDAAGDIVERYADQLWCVGVFRNQEDHQIVRIVERDGLRVVHRRRAVAAHAPSLNPQESETVVAVIVDSAQPGSGIANDWEQVTSLHFEVPVIVAGGINPETVAAVITATRPWGVDVASGVEILHGVKDPAKVASFVSRARAALTQKGAQ